MDTPTTDQEKKRGNYTEERWDFLPDWDVDTLLREALKLTEPQP